MFTDGFVLHGFKDDGRLVVWVVDFAHKKLKNTKVALICGGVALMTKKVVVNNVEIGEPFEPPSITTIGTAVFPVAKEIKGNPDCTIVVSMGNKKMDPIRI